MQLCRRCGKRPSVTSDGFCYSCKKKEVMRGKLDKFGQRQRWLNRFLSGGIIDG